MSKVEAAINDLKAGKLIIVQDDFDRENEGDLIGLIDFISPQEINFMLTHGKGIVCAAISAKYAKMHNLKLLEQINSDQTNFLDSIDGPTSTTGVSAKERYQTIKDLLRPHIKFKTPGHVFPLLAQTGGLLIRRGHTEAAVDLAKLANASEVGVIVEIINANGTMARKQDLHALAQKWNLALITISEIVAYIEEKNISLWKDQADSSLVFSKVANIPTIKGIMKMQVVQEPVTGNEAILYFQKDLKHISHVRIHSECQTSEIFESLKCDCKNQLNFFMKQVQKHQDYLLIYTKDEGRGIGIFNKINAYYEQDHGLDTVEANLKINQPAEKRDFSFAGKILQELKINKVKLYTNNPQKIAGLTKFGIKVKREAIWQEENDESKSYLATKKIKDGAPLISFYLRIFFRMFLFHRFNKFFFGHFSVLSH